MATVRKLAGEIGPREATSPAFREAATWVGQQFAALGYDVQRQPLHVPSGVSWGVPVKAGQTWNVVARPRGMKKGEPYLLVGTRRVRRVRGRGTAGQRGSGDHYGSRAMVARMSAAERKALRGMGALDRVGVGQRVPICDGGLGAGTVVRSVRRSAQAIGVATSNCGVNRLSDHWSFQLAGLPAARIGGTPYAQYHSARDLPPVVDLAQLDRSGRVLWAWLRR